MKRDSQKNDEHLKDVQQDIQFLLSNIRARENGLIFFLERFTTDSKYPEQFAPFKEEFMQKEKIYASQVARIVTKYSLARTESIEQHIRTFWIKVKSIVRVSLDRLKILGLLNEKIFARYDEIINLINKNYDQQKGLQDFTTVENLLKKRNIDALLFGRGQLASPKSASKITKNRSESTLKKSKYSPKPKQQLEFAVKLELDVKETNDVRQKSLNQYRKKKVLLDNKVPQDIEKTYKKMAKNLEKYQKCFEGAMKGGMDFPIDRRKTVKENSEAMYDDLFQKNIPNHKMISKFIFGAGGMAFPQKKQIKFKPKKLIIKAAEKQSKELVKLNKTKPHKQYTRERPHSTQQQLRSTEDDKRRMIQNLVKTEDEKRRMTQTVGEKKGKYRKRVSGALEKYHKLIRLIS